MKYVVTNKDGLVIFDGDNTEHAAAIVGLEGVKGIEANGANDDVVMHDMPDGGFFITIGDEVIVTIHGMSADDFNTITGVKPYKTVPVSLS